MNSAPRSPAIDALRGIAIVTMLASNLAAPCLRAPHPMWLRIVGSLAAPTFVLLAGMMTAFGTRPAPLLRLLKRAVLLLALGAAIDVACWKIAPFETFDVLYLLGLALPLVGLCTYLRPAWHWALALAVLAATPVLHRAVGYGPALPVLPQHWSSVWRPLLVTGWFPLFPWLGVALAGGALARSKPLSAERVRPVALAGAVLVSLGALAWWLSPPALPTRAGYSELFYPASPQYLAIALGAIALLLAGLHTVPRRYSLAWLSTLGRSSLLLYVTHIAVIAFALRKHYADLGLPSFLALYVALLVGMWLLAWTTQRWRTWLPPARVENEAIERSNPSWRISSHSLD